MGRKLVYQYMVKIRGKKERLFLSIPGKGEGLSSDNSQTFKCSPWMSVDSSRCIVWVRETDRVHYKLGGDFSSEFSIFLLNLEMIPNCKIVGIETGDY